MHLTYKNVKGVTKNYRMYFCNGKRISKNAYDNLKSQPVVVTQPVVTQPITVQPVVVQPVVVQPVSQVVVSQPVVSQHEPQFYLVFPKSISKTFPLSFPLRIFFSNKKYEENEKDLEKGYFNVLSNTEQMV